MLNNKYIFTQTNKHTKLSGDDEKKISTKWLIFFHTILEVVVVMDCMGPKPQNSSYLAKAKLPLKTRYHPISCP